MSTVNCSCSCKCNCTVAALIISLIVGIIGAFLQITAVIAIAPVFLWAALGVAVVYLGGLAAAMLLARAPRQQGICGCSSLNALLLGVLGTILVAVILLIVDVVAASVIGAILTGLLLGFLALTFTATACYIRSLTDCES